MPFTVIDSSPMDFVNLTPVVGVAAIRGMLRDDHRSIGAAYLLPGITSSVHSQKSSLRPRHLRPAFGRPYAIRSESRDVTMPFTVIESSPIVF